MLRERRVRTADAIAVASPFVASEAEIVSMIESLRGLLRRIG